MSSNQSETRCSFCGRTKNEVAHLVASGGAYICSDCVKMCAQIVEFESSGEGAGRTTYCYSCQSLKEPTDFVRIPMPSIRICKECLTTLRKLPDS